MPRTHGANKSILFAQIFEPYVVNLSGFAKIKHVLFAHVYKALTLKMWEFLADVNGLYVLVFSQHLLSTHSLPSRPFHKNRASKSVDRSF